jgi:hypothetical protein
MFNLVDYNAFAWGFDTTAVPGAGAGISFGTPANRLAELISIHFSLTTAAAGPNRYIVLNHTLPGYAADFATPDIAHAGGVTLGYTGGLGLSQPGLTPVNIVVFGLPHYPVFKGQAGESITVSIRGVQAGDQLTAIHVCWRFWPIVV